MRTPRRHLALVLEVISDPGELCALPPSRRICFALGCAENLTTRLARGQNHGTRCARDTDAGAPGYALGRGPRSATCGRSDDCDALHEAALRAAEPDAPEPDVHCPPSCTGYRPLALRRIA